ncbi:hypothetical protein [Streptomyces subrutilus]|uniref:Uncharacterized protein n=1 Tax=Streptomyces subrutilus TaxID=36818 RepID=A0A1E5NXM5_9ACTN|nr:hypothetical protein [Streptomyces subrutilus]OEJ21004.1 hypothetical protein BGK67_34475 [Streptomyces subrutilus]
MTPEILARITAARAARDLSDLARQVVGASATPATPADRLIAARRLRQLANALVDYTVVAEALSGTSWESMAAALSRHDAATLQGEYEDSVEDWAALDAGVLDEGAQSAPDLDAWYLRHREDADPAGETPVSDLLDR